MKNKHDDSCTPPLSSNNPSHKYLIFLFIAKLSNHLCPSPVFVVPVFSTLFSILFFLFSSPLNLNLYLFFLALLVHYIYNIIGLPKKNPSILHICLFQQTTIPFKKNTHNSPPSLFFFSFCNKQRQLAFLMLEFLPKVLCMQRTKVDESCRE